MKRAGGGRSLRLLHSIDLTEEMGAALVNAFVPASKQVTAGTEENAKACVIAGIVSERGWTNQREVWENAAVDRGAIRGELRKRGRATQKAIKIQAASADSDLRSVLTSHRTKRSAPFLPLYRAWTGTVCASQVRNGSDQAVDSPHGVWKFATIRVMALHLESRIFV